MSLRSAVLFRRLLLSCFFPSRHLSSALASTSALCVKQLPGLLCFPTLTSRSSLSLLHSPQHVPLRCRRQSSLPQTQAPTCQDLSSPCHFPKTSGLRPWHKAEHTACVLCAHILLHPLQAMLPSHGEPQQEAGKAFPCTRIVVPSNRPVTVLPLHYL